MKHRAIKHSRLADTAAESVINYGVQETALESHLQALQDRYRELARIASTSKDLADVRLQMARTLVNLERGAEAWPLGREALDTFPMDPELSVELVTHVVDETPRTTRTVPPPPPCSSPTPGPRGRFDREALQAKLPVN